MSEQGNIEATIRRSLWETVSARAAETSDAR